MQPAKPSTDMTPPTTTNSHTGSRPPRSVSAEMLERTPCARKQTSVREWLPFHLSAGQPPSLLPSHPRPKGRWPGTGPPAPAKAAQAQTGHHQCQGSSKPPTHPSPALTIRKLMEEPSPHAVNGCIYQEHLSGILSHRLARGTEATSSLGLTAGLPGPPGALSA